MSDSEATTRQGTALTAICVGQPDPERVQQVLWELMVHRQQRLAREAAERDEDKEAPQGKEAA
jgi:hypothetical protein